MPDVVTPDPQEPVPIASTEPAPRPAPDEARRFGPWQREAWAFLELLALTGIAFAQPYFDIVSKNAELFVTRSTSGAQFILLTALAVLLPAAVAWTIEVVVSLIAPRARRWAHGALAAIAIGVIAAEVVKHQTDFGPTPLVLAGIAVGLVGGWLVIRFAGIRTWLRLLSIAPILFALLFVTSSQASKVVFQSNPPAAKVAVKHPTRVVMVVMDEFPLESLLDGHGKIDATLFPNFAALSHGSTWYRNDSTVAPFTEAAVPAILTGQFPQDEKAQPTAAEHPENLFTLLGGTYNLNVHESLTHLCPDTLCTQTHRATVEASSDFGSLVNDTVGLWRDYAKPSRDQASIPFNVGAAVLGDSDAAGTGQAFVDSLQPQTRPTLDFLHILLPHQPWRYLPNGTRYEIPARNPGFVLYGWGSEWAALSGRQRHLLQLQYADHLLGEVVARLKKIGAYDNSLMVVTADHGVAFTAQTPVRGVTKTNYPQIVWPPLFIKAPKQKVATIDDHTAYSIDILPTIEQYLGVKAPWKIDGRSLLGKRRPEGPRPVFEWYLNGLKPTSGKYFTVDGAKGFAAALKGQASAATGDPHLRLYKVGPYGALVGTPAAPYVDPAPSGTAATLDNATSWDNVKLHAKDVPWEFASGRLLRTQPDRYLAVVVNGMLAGFPKTYTEPGSQTLDQYWTNIPPTLLHDGKNTIDLYTVSGASTDPHLQLVPIAR
jgi:Sulfatase